MVFSSITFLYYFIPAVMVLYFLSPQKLRNVVLLIASLIFYAWGEPKYILLMVITILIGYGAGLIIEKAAKKSLKRLTLILAVVLFVGSLCYFKYSNFLISNVNSILHKNYPLLKVVLPIGISFYSFQIISYLIDVYRGEVPAQKNVLKLGCYIAMFPQLIAGPIVRYSTIAKELDERKHSFAMAAEGIRRFMFGLAKKIIIANNLGSLCELLKSTQNPSVMTYWVLAVAIMLHIYFDFSGYSDMAIGLGKIFGFNFCENFNYPYIAGSVTDFWRRWHMSLGTWFRDYVYIPLGGNKKGQFRWFLNILIVWGLTGLWHGASWNFVLWGLFYAVFLIIEKKWLLKHLNKAKVWNHIYTLFLVMGGFIIFDCTSLAEIGNFFSSMWGFKGLPFVSNALLYEIKSYGVLLVLAILCSTPLLRKLFGIIKSKLKKPVWSNIGAIAEPIVYMVLLVIMTASLVNGSFNPFLYFRF